MKSLFNFYLDDNQKQKAMEKLERLVGEKQKGLLASFIRVSIAQFNALPDDKVNPLLLQAIEAEFEYTLKKNKRSKL